MTAKAKVLSVFMMWMAFCLTPALAEDAPAPPPPEARALIEHQLDAFAHDDAAGAYALAAPGIQAMFPDAETFMTMVKASYAAIYRHRSVEFGGFVQQGEEVEQALTIVDSDNAVWKAIYKLERQPDGSWRTTGCLLSKSSESSL